MRQRQIDRKEYEGSHKTIFLKTIQNDKIAKYNEEKILTVLTLKTYNLCY